MSQYHCFVVCGGTSSHMTCEGLQERRGRDGKKGGHAIRNKPTGHRRDNGPRQHLETRVDWAHGCMRCPADRFCIALLTSRLYTLRPPTDLMRTIRACMSLIRAPQMWVGGHNRKL